LAFIGNKKKNFEYQGSLLLTKNENNTMTVINKLPIEKYLYSVISSEMSSLASLELLKAHAVISGSFAHYQMLNKENSTKKDMIITDDEIYRWYNREAHIKFDVCSDDHCQRYQGTSKIFSDNAEKAIKETFGLTLMSNNKICDAKYYKSCGGWTEQFSSAWENIDYDYLQASADFSENPANFNYPLSDEKNAELWIKGNPPAYCNVTNVSILKKILPDFDQKTPDFYRWKITYSQECLQSILKKKLNIDFGLIKKIIPLKRGNSGRIYLIKIAGSKKEMTIGKELEIRRALSESHLYSSAFIVETESKTDSDIPDIFHITGAGWGHGVGLCQIGAAQMAENGFLYTDILKHYYKNSSLTKLY